MLFFTIPLGGDMSTKEFYQVMVIEPTVSVPIPKLISREDPLKELQALVGGFIEVLRLPNSRYLVIGEEGKLTPHVCNVLATELAQEYGSLARSDYIAGTAVIVDGEVLD
jgi:hypothetical protein